MNFAAVLICQLLALSTCIYFVICENVVNCIRKCCSEDFTVSSVTKDCIPANRTNSFRYENFCSVHLGKCQKGTILAEIPEKHIEILENNTLLYNSSEVSVLFQRDQFCVDFQDSYKNVTLACVKYFASSNDNKKEAVGEKTISSCIKKCCSHGSFLAVDSLNCLKAENLFELSFKKVCPPVGRFDCKNKIPYILSKNMFTIDKSLLKYEYQSQLVYFPKDDFCVEHDNSGNVVALVCLDHPIHNKITDEQSFLSKNIGCITRCCPSDSAFNQASGQCVEVNQTVLLPYDNICHLSRKTCKNDKLSAGIPEQLFKIQDNQTLVYSFRNESRFFENDDYCVEYKDDLKGVLALVCVDPPPYAIGEKTGSTGMIISMPFLLATFIAYALLPDRNLHMKALMFYVISLMLSYLLLCIIQLTESAFSTEVCMSLGYFCLFFFLVSFFWMNVICIDIWFAFSGLRGFSGSKKEAERKRFFMYCGYAWGVPTVHVLIVYLIQQSTEEKDIFNPGIGTGQCFLGRGFPELLYFYGPMAILITVNVIFFATTACRIRSIKRDTSMLKKEDSKRHSYENDKQT